jgi:hypothetical protein
MGVVQGGSVGQVIFTLPAGYRPPQTRLFLGDTSINQGGWGSVSEILVFTTGDVTFRTGPTLGALVLDLLSFVSA